MYTILYRLLVIDLTQFFADLEHRVDHKFYPSDLPSSDATDLHTVNDIGEELRGFGDNSIA